MAEGPQEPLRHPTHGGRSEIHQRNDFIRKECSLNGKEGFIFVS